VGGFFCLDQIHRTALGRAYICTAYCFNDWIFFHQTPFKMAQKKTYSPKKYGGYNTRGGTTKTRKRSPALGKAKKEAQTYKTFFVVGLAAFALASSKFGWHKDLMPTKQTTPKTPIA